MENSIKQITDQELSQGVLLLDHYDEAAAMLSSSFRRAGFTGPVIVLADSGFLPADVISLYRCFCRDSEGTPFPGTKNNCKKITDRAAAESAARDEILPEAQAKPGSRQYQLSHAGWRMGKARYFNQIELPDYWEITGNGVSGEIHDLQHLRGRIFFAAPSARRRVSEVDWLNEKGIVRCTDHYDNSGILYSRTVFNKKGERFCRSWFDEEARERIVENYVTGDILVNRNGKITLFRNRTELAVSMLKEIGADGRRIFYNSLSIPLFVTEKMKKPEKGNVLFWQEGPRNDIPGNMKMILEGRSNTSEILVQNRESLKNLLRLGASDQVLKPMGYLYGYRRKNRGGKDILICTNSDQIEQLQEIAENLPAGMQLHIAAVTEMSAKLLAFGKYENIRLYPCARESLIDELLDKCDYYLDINHGGEIVSAVKQAFLHDELILGFRKTLHNPWYTAEENQFSDAADLCGVLKHCHADSEVLQKGLRAQKDAAMEETEGAYQKLFED
jgi:accessory Sec system glycosyltransferase GtfB